MKLTVTLTYCYTAITHTHGLISLTDDIPLTVLHKTTPSDAHRCKRPETVELVELVWGCVSAATHFP